MLPRNCYDDCALVAACTTRLADPGNIVGCHPASCVSLDILCEEIFLDLMVYFNSAALPQVDTSCSQYVHLKFLFIYKRLIRVVRPIDCVKSLVNDLFLLIW